LEVIKVMTGLMRGETMAEGQIKQIYPRIGDDVRQQLMDFCKEQGASQGAVVEEALRRFLGGEVREHLDRLLMQRLLEFDVRLQQHTEGITQMADTLNAQQETLGKIIPLLGAIIATLEEQTKEKEVPVADWDDLYKDDPDMQPGPPEGELVAEADLTTLPAPQDPIQPVGWYERLFGPRRTP
jgi:hypothetical protein